MGTWVCPNDRQLALRAKLGAGWSVHSSKNSPSLFGKTERLTSEETEKILKVIRQAERIDQVEMSRIGHLVDKLENMMTSATGNGNSDCLLCGDQFRLLGASPSRCQDCNKFTCSKCGVDTINSKARPIHLCKICSESRELWRKSGAWFYRGLPGFVRPKSRSSHSSLRVTNRSLRSSPIRGLEAGLLAHSGQQHLQSDDHSNSSSGPAHSRFPPPPSFARFMKKNNKNNNNNNRGNNSDSSDDDEVNVIRKRVRPQESESDSDISQNAISQSKGVDIDGQSDSGTNLKQPMRGQVAKSTDDDKHCGVPQEPSALIRNSCNNNNTNNNDNNSRNGDNNTSHYDNNGCSTTATTSTTNHHNNNNKIIAGSSNNNSNKDSRKPSLFLLQDKQQQQSLDHVTSDEDPGSLPETPASLGILEFSLLYNSRDKLLRCVVHRAKNLPAMDKNGFSDPYVKLHLLPGVAKSTKRRTKTIRRTRNPEWNETLEYHGITEQDVKDKIIRFSIFDEDRVGADFIGETRINLKSLVPDVTREFSVYLSGLQVMLGEEEEDAKSKDRGRILLGLMYSTVGEKLIVSVRRCSNLIAMDSNGLSDPYVKIYLKPDKDKKTKNKTKVKSKTLNPVFNEDFYYPVKFPELTKKTLEVTVWDKDFGRNEIIGGVEFGPDSGMAELRHWLDVLKRPNEMAEQWHILKMTKSHVVEQH